MRGTVVRAVYLGSVKKVPRHGAHTEYTGATCFNYLILICFDFEANSCRKGPFVLLFALEEWATESYHVVSVW